MVVQERLLNRFQATVDGFRLHFRLCCKNLLLHVAGVEDCLKQEAATPNRVAMSSNRPRLTAFSQLKKHSFTSRGIT